MVTGTSFLGRGKGRRRVTTGRDSGQTLVQVTCSAAGILCRHRISADLVLTNVCRHRQARTSNSRLLTAEELADALRLAFRAHVWVEMGRLHLLRVGIVTTQRRRSVNETLRSVNV